MGKMMRYKNAVGYLTILIVILAGIAAACGIFLAGGGKEVPLRSLHQNLVMVYGQGLYKNESVSMALQARAQDGITLFLGIPFLLWSFLIARRGSLKGRFLLLGFLGYLLYTYTTYSFGAMYNGLFLVYVALMSTCFFAFILTFLSLGEEDIESRLDTKFPEKFVGVILIITAVAASMMWLKRICIPLINKEVPGELEHYTTMVIQALDLAILLPTGILAGILLMKKNKFGYLLAPVMVIKQMVLVIVIIAMFINQAVNGLTTDGSELVVFLVIAVILSRCLYLFLKNIKE
jgi:hypothetical protein